MRKPTTPPKIILSIPGPWTDQDDLDRAIAERGLDLHLEREKLTSSHSGQAVTVELAEYDASVQQAFAAAGRKSLTRTDLDAIGAHHSTVYVIGPGGSFDAAREMLEIGGELLKAGGIAVKVETSGVAHSATDWLTYCGRKTTHVGALYLAYVVVVNNKGTYYSCGMHNLGLPDAIVTSNLGTEDILQLLQGFLLYILHKNPDIQNGQQFSASEHKAWFRLAYEACQTYPVDDPFYNLYGMWRLLPI